MRTVISFTSFILICSCLIACGDDQQNGTNQTGPNTLESLLNPNASATTATPGASPTSTSLNDIWVLAAINSQQKYDVNFVNNTPVLDLDSANKSMSGHTGCNSISGKLRVQGNKLIFDSVMVNSKQPCNDKGFEKKLLSSFKGGNTTYKVANDTLHLSVGGAEFMYRRIRRAS